jgi:hypothetical protein
MPDLVTCSWEVGKAGDPGVINKLGVKIHGCWGCRAVLCVSVLLD